jgi:hypothetical protein
MARGPSDGFQVLPRADASSTRLERGYDLQIVFTRRLRERLD